MFQKQTFKALKKKKRIIPDIRQLLLGHAVLCYLGQAAASLKMGLYSGNKFNK